MLFNDPTLFQSTFLTFLQDLCSIPAPIQPKNGWENIRNQNLILFLHLWTTQLQQGQNFQVELFRSNELNCINSCVTCCFCSPFNMSSCFEFFKRFTIVKLLTRICCILSFCALFLHWTEEASSVKCIRCTNIYCAAFWNSIFKNLQRCHVLQVLLCNLHDNLFDFVPLSSTLVLNMPENPQIFFNCLTACIACKGLKLFVNEIIVSNFYLSYLQSSVIRQKY